MEMEMKTKIPSLNGKINNKDCFIKVNPSCGRFHLYREGDVSEIKLLDIASSIARQCRFTGHLIGDTPPYSVAEHCVHVSRIVERMNGSPKQIFASLMHDAAEAYLSDIAAPFKRELADYHEKEALIQARINKRFGIENSHDPIIKKADWYALWIEARQIVEPNESELCKWFAYDKTGVNSKKYYFEVQCWDHIQARDEFIKRFAQCQDICIGEYHEKFI